MVWSRVRNIGWLVLSIGMLGGSQPNGDELSALAKNDRPGVPKGGLTLTVKYVEFDLRENKSLYDEIIKVRHRDATELVQRLSNGAKRLKQLQTDMPLAAGGASQASDSMGESMLRVKLTSVTEKDGSYAIMADLGRWDRTRDGKLDFTCGTENRRMSLEPGGFQVVSLEGPIVIDTNTNKPLKRCIEVWMVRLWRADIAERPLTVQYADHLLAQDGK